MERPKVRLHLLKVGKEVNAGAILAIFKAIAGRDPTPDEIAEVQRELVEDDGGSQREKDR